MQIVLLEKAYTNAEEAARITQGTLTARLQAYRLWVVTAYMHEVRHGGGGGHHPLSGNTGTFPAVVVAVENNFLRQLFGRVVHFRHTTLSV